MSYPADPAALFIELYDRLPEEPFLRSEPDEWEQDARVRRQATRICEHIWMYGEVDPGQVKEIIGEGGPREVFTVLRGIDWALEIINPFAPYFEHDGLDKLAVRYATTGRLNDGPAAEGALLPRCAYPGKPRGARDKALYFGLNRVSAQSWAKIRHNKLPNRYEPARFRPGNSVEVGCVPLLETLEDIQFKVLSRNGRSVFSLAPVDTEPFRDRISSALSKLDDSGAEIGVIPEGALTDGLLQYWKEEAVRTAPRAKRLRWLLVGTGPLISGDDPPPNRAVLLDRRTGAVLLSQDKLAAFVLTAAQARDWHLPVPVASGSAAEHITRGSALAVLETSLGRLAILICEDLSQSVEWERELIECGISHMVVPIFSKPIMDFRWERQGAERQIRNTGSWLIIANSLVVQRAMEATPNDGEQWYTCLIAGPGDPDRENWNFSFQFGRAGAGDDPGRMEIDGGLPAIQAAVVQESWLSSPPI